MLWRFLLDPNIGLVNHYLGAARTAGRHAWLTVRAVGLDLPGRRDRLVDARLQRGHLPGGLQDIPPSSTRRPKMDGAGRWQRFRNVTLPGLRPVLLFVLT